MNYSEALSYLSTLGSFTDVAARSQRMKGFDLEPYREFLRQIGNPQQGLKYIHVAGSKGKGSTCTYLAEILRKLGYKTGLYTSPYLQTLREEFWINGEMISEEEFVEILLLVREQVELYGVNLSYFEFVTTMMFFYFKKQQVDYAVLEVGLGGLKDATNVVDPVLTIITQLELEHTDVLGETIEKIAYNKLGIVKFEVPLVVMKQKHDVAEQIKKHALELDSDVTFVEERFGYEVKSISLDGMRLHIKGGEFDNAKFAADLHLKMLGEQFAHSFVTALTALMALFQYKDLGVEGAQELLAVAGEVGKELQLPWRFEIVKINEGRIVVLDMAHTVEGLRYLRSTLNEVFANTTITFVVAALQDKDVAGMFAGLLNEKDKLVVTSSSSPRALMASELLVKAGFDTLPEGQVLLVDDDAVLAFQEILKRTSNKDVLVLTGSHYLLNDLSFFFSSF